MFLDMGADDTVAFSSWKWNDSTLMTLAFPYMYDIPQRKVKQNKTKSQNIMHYHYIPTRMATIEEKEILSIGKEI